MWIVYICDTVWIVYMFYRELKAIRRFIRDHVRCTAQSAPFRVGFVACVTLNGLGVRVSAYSPVLYIRHVGARTLLPTYTELMR